MLVAIHRRPSRSLDSARIAPACGRSGMPQGLPGPAVPFDEIASERSHHQPRGRRQQGRHVVVGEGRRVAAVEDGEADAVESHQPLLRAQPQVAVGRLRDDLHRVLGQAVLRVERVQAVLVERAGGVERQRGRAQEGGGQAQDESHAPSAAIGSGGGPAPIRSVPISFLEHEGGHAAAARAHVDDRILGGARDGAHLGARDVERVGVDLEAREAERAALESGNSSSGIVTRSWTTQGSPSPALTASSQAPAGVSEPT